MIRQIRFIRPGSHFVARRWHLGLFSFYTHKDDKAYSGLAIHLRGLTIWLLASLAAGYLGAVSALYLMWRGQPYLTLSYREMLVLPANWGSIRHRRALASIAEGLQAMKDRRWEEAEIRIRAGLQAAPDALQGRLELARFYLLTGRWPAGARLISEGLDRGYPGKAFLGGALTQAWASDDLDHCSQWALMALKRWGPSLSPGDRTWLVDCAAQILAARGQWDAVLQLASARTGEKGTVLRQAEIEALLARSRVSEAFSRLDDWRLAHPAPDPARDRLMTSALRQAGMTAQMEGELNSICSANPGDPGCLIFAMDQRFKAGRAASARATLGRILMKFGGQERVLEAALQCAEAENDDASVDRILSFARSGASLPKQMLLSEAIYRLSKRQVQEARGFFAELDQAWNLKDPRERFLSRFYELIVEAVVGQGEAPGKRLDEYCEREATDWRDLAGAADLMEKAGRPDLALGMAEVGVSRYPANYHLRELRRRIQAAAGRGAKAATAPR